MKTFCSFSILLLLAGLLSVSACQKSEDQGATDTNADLAPTQSGDLTPQIPDDIRQQLEAQKAAQQKAEEAITTATQDAGQESAPTAQVVGQVKISKKLTAEGLVKYAGQPGVVRLHWETESEKENFGFNVLRSTSQDGEYKVVNADIIAGAGNSSTNRSYDYYDTTVMVGEEYYYYLVDIKANGIQSEIVAKTPITVKMLNLDAVDVDDSDPVCFVQE